MADKTNTNNGIKPSLKDQLSGITLNLKEYGHLPQHEVLFGLKDSLSDDDYIALNKQWDKLRLLRKNLIVLGKYIIANDGETLNEWLNSNKEQVANEVTKNIGDFNDSNKGISAYFLNLQDLYDRSEIAYDDMENNLPVPDEQKANFEDMRTERGVLRADRIKARKGKLKGFSKDEKGYLVIPDDRLAKEDTPPVEPPKETMTAEEVQTPFNADADATPPIEPPPATPTPSATSEEITALPKSVKNNHKKFIAITILLAGGLITIWALSSKEEAK